MQNQNAEIINPLALNWLFATLVFVSIPHIDHLPLWCLIFIASTAILKLNTILKKNTPTPKWIIVLMTIAAVTGIVMEYSQLFGRNAGITMLVVMLFLKMLETQTYRDGMLLATMMCFLVITNFLFEQKIIMGLYMLIGVVGITHTFIKLNELATTSKPYDIPIKASKITALSIPCMIIFFFIFPRIPGPLWGLPADASSARTGLSDQMSFGNIGNLALSNEPAFRVEFKGKAPSQRELYWRGVVLENFDGEVWTEHKENIPAEDYSVGGNRYEYTVTLEPHNKKWMFALEMPVNTASIAGSQFNSRYQLADSKEIKNLKQYSLTSFSTYTINSTLSQESRERNTTLPEGTNPKTRALAQQWRQETRTDLELVQKSLQFFRNEVFYYSLKPPLLSGEKFDDFLFNTRKGFCEHYSGSFVFLMRAAGIPARVVTGYQGGESNQLSDYMLVKQADAHAWAEVWLNGRGWVRVDPTAAISPERIESNLDEALESSENPRFTLSQDNPLLKSMRLLMDSANHNWNQWIIAYDRQKQKQLFKKLGFKYKASTAVIGLTIFISILFVAIYIYILQKRRAHTPKQKHQKLYEKFILVCKKNGLIKQPYENASQFSHRASEKFPYAKKIIDYITKHYNQMQYHKPPKEQLIEYKDSIKLFRRTLRQHKK